MCLWSSHADPTALEPFINLSLSCIHSFMELVVITVLDANASANNMIKYLSLTWMLNKSLLIVSRLFCNCFVVCKRCVTDNNFFFESLFSSLSPKSVFSTLHALIKLSYDSLFVIFVNILLGRYDLYDVVKLHVFTKMLKMSRCNTNGIEKSKESLYH